jgi:glycosyltransferase involved in cell wall biosynthesis
MSSHATRLTIMVAEHISEWIDKGEVVDRYYNPGDLFDEVEIVLANDDDPNPAAIQRLVGRATWSISRFPTPQGFFYRTAGLRLSLVRRWAQPAVEHVLARRPALIRCHGSDLNGVIAAEVRRRASIPLVLSLHTNPGESRRFVQRRWRNDPKAAILAAANAPVQRIGVRHADCVICVYRYIVPWARSAGARRVEVIPNAVANGRVVAKRDYHLRDPPRVVVPGRQTHGKDPTPVIDAIARLPGVELLLIGDGDLHEALRRRAAKVGVSDRVHFQKRVPNAELMGLLPKCDILVSVNDHGGVSKVDLEAALTGLPIVTNAHPSEEVPELLGEACVAVAGDAGSYEAALRDLLADERRRAALGRAVRRPRRRAARARSSISIAA